MTGKLRNIRFYVVNVVAAIILAYPLCGFAAAVWVLLHDFPWTIYHPLEYLVYAFRIVIWYGIAASTHGVLPEVDAAGRYHFSAYPFVIPTALALIFFRFRGWRLFKLRRLGTDRRNVS
jgi:hypothetical protein